MANLQERRDKDGKLISYSIRVYRGRDQNGKMLKPWTTTFNVPSTWSEKSARKKAMAYAANFEKACREGTVADTRRCFGEYATYVIDLREARGMKPSTVYHYRHLANRINVAIGHLKLSDIRPDHLNDLYTDVAKESIAASYYIAKVDLAVRLKERGISKAAFENSTGVSHPTLNKAIGGGARFRREGACDCKRASFGFFKNLQSRSHGGSYQRCQIGHSVSPVHTYGAGAGCEGGAYFL
ncbi:MAG: hypothetical protein LUH36_01010 [Oscillospiraceae bacterium]|nr:hypothetical protein [Oscillospiraceae bacterium]